MIQRSINIGNKSSFFLFGARGTGKSTYLRQQFRTKNPFWVDLLKPEVEEIFSRRPETLEHELDALKKKNKSPDWIIIDEVQKVPALLNVVHHLIENHRYRFALTGSSARKLRRGHANMLGGRANVYALFPFTAREISSEFDLHTALNWGTLPRVHELKESDEKLAALRSYVQTYIKEEILVEQLVRNVHPFRGFLELSAQFNCERINYQKLAREIDVDHKTVQTYFDILEDTYLGFRLPAFHRSVRKSQLMQPKFYWFDGGVQRFISGQIHSKLIERTSSFGEAFEAWIINEIYRMNFYGGWDAKLSYLQTKNGAEVDLILSRGKESIAIEIKSTDRLDPSDAVKFETLAQDIPYIKKMILISRDPRPKRIGGVDALDWQSAFRDWEMKGPF